MSSFCYTRGVCLAIRNDWWLAWIYRGNSNTSYSWLVVRWAICTPFSCLRPVLYPRGWMADVVEELLPVPSLGKLNRLGLVNMFGLLACFSCLGLVLSAIPSVRRARYHIFQRLHLSVAMMFVLCCALHDLSILLFGIPGLADWYLGYVVI